MTLYKAIGASAGVAIGRVFLLDRRRVSVPKYAIEKDQINYEVERLRTAIDSSVSQLEAIRNQFIVDGIDHQAILEAHGMMLRDRALFDEAAALIGTKCRNAEWAIHKVLGRLRTILESSSDSYFRERQGDIDFIGDRILRNLTGRNADLIDLGDLGTRAVVVAHDLCPADTAILLKQRVMAFVTEVGGKTSHTSIIARSLGIPAVVGVHGICDSVCRNDTIIVDGLNGTVQLNPNAEQLTEGRNKGHKYQRLKLEMLESKELPAESQDHFKVQLQGNIELPSDVEGAQQHGAEGIGLYRTEYMFLGGGGIISEEAHYRNYCRILTDIGPHPVTIRTFDLGGDKLFGIAEEKNQPEANPALGLRAIRFSLQNPDLFKAQIAGLLRAATRGDLRILLPMISSVQEVRDARTLIFEVEDKLQKQGITFCKDVPVGAMIEVPSAVTIADLLAQEVDFFSIGTNDLLQYLLAIDRTNDQLSYMYNPNHPAVLRSLKHVADVCAAHNLPLSVCGEIAGDPDQIPILLGLGITSLSMNSNAIPMIKRMIRSLKHTECEQLLNASLSCATQQEVNQLVHSFLADRGLAEKQLWLA